MIDVILLKANKIDVYKDRSTKQVLAHMKQAFSLYKLDVKMKSEIDFFDALIYHEALINKSRMEACFEDARRDLFDYWDNLSYQERNRLISLKNDELKNDLHYFKSSNGSYIWIAFFDELLNALYDKELAILELPQYFKLYRNFKDRTINIEQYGLEPYKQAYIEIHVIKRYDESVIFYYSNTKSLYQINAARKLRRFALSKSIGKLIPLKEELEIIAQAMLEEHELEAIEYLLRSTLIEDKTKKQLIKYQKKLTRKSK
jgi:hypothetical protein